MRVRTKQYVNTTLYNMLQFHFKDVRVTNEGEGLLGQFVRDAQQGWRYEVIYPGEYYVVNCPFCNDTRHRLNINHSWGVALYDPDGNRHTNLWLAVCFNERCLEDADQRAELWEKITEGEYSRYSNVKLAPAKVVKPTDVKADWPGPVTPLNQLGMEHKAYQYLVGRGFDPDVCTKFWGVQYCHQAINYLARDRIIIPVFSRGVLRGWQARLPYDLKKGVKWPPKYYTMPGMPRRDLIYNLGNAQRYKTGIIVEGPLDVWRTGPMGMCTFGASMPLPQRQRVMRAFNGYTLVLCFDPEEFEKKSTKTLIDAFKHDFEPTRFAAIKLPEGTDPGSLERGVLRQFITAEAKKQGVHVSWDKR